ncbi:TolC family protein [Stieleria sp. TO1_6]|uniref:TolC family protein n=1 Tax=Stieleria tagensis TaxID=2956795 RepID=UPI00209ABE45|nr:TolC family protein [Stieleria tagensis]MCO8121048.1 TolC family protein [Stieleria tagensis]
MKKLNESSKQIKRGRLRAFIATLAFASTVPATLGCSILDRIGPGPHDTTTSYHQSEGLSIEYPEVAECATPVTIAAQATTQPLSLEDPSKLPTLDLPLEEAVAMAMRNSPVIRSLNTSVTTPLATSTVYDPGDIASSQQGTEAALSAFDAQYTQALNWSRTDRPNVFRPAFSGLPNAFPSASDSNNAAFTGELQKRTALGSTFSLRHIVNYSHYNVNAENQIFPSTFTGWVEAEWRQPILRGAGLQYNRIVGNAIIPGQYNGVLIARINEDVALADFENSVIGLVADVEQAYWDLFIAYRELEVFVKGREAALKTYQYQKARLDVGAGRQDEEAQARSQYFQFQANVQAQLAGPTGLYAQEQRLRYLLGMPATDGKLIKPITNPIDSKVVFDWASALSQALDRRVEVRRQRFQVKQRELELYAARLNKRPQLDFVGLYRFQGLGDHLIGDDSNFSTDGLYTSIKDKQFQEWQAGVEFVLPVGLRRAAVAVANAKLGVQRDRAILAETELKISHDLSDAARNIDVTYQLLETNYNRYESDRDQVNVLRSRYVEGEDNINFFLQAQRAVVESEIQFYRSLANYNLSIRDLHRQKGSLLAYNQIQLAEGPWEAGATRDAYEKGLFLTPRRDPSDVQMSAPITRQAFDPSAIQSTGTAMPNQSLIPMENEVPMENDEPTGNDERLFNPADPTTEFTPPLTSVDTENAG